MTIQTRRIGLSLGADICWPICFEEIIKDLDLVIVNSFLGEILYFQNIGSPVSPVFVEIVGDQYPFRSLDFFPHSLDLIDVDADGDLDLFLGKRAGNVVFLRFRPGAFADDFETGDTSLWPSPR